MNRNGIARTILTVDSAGCATAGAVLAGVGPIADALGFTSGQRLALSSALGATSTMLGVGATERRPSKGTLTRAALVNMAWVTACSIALMRRPNRVAGAIIAATAIADGTAAGIQWWVRPDS